MELFCWILITFLCQQGTASASATTSDYQEEALEKNEVELTTTTTLASSLDPDAHCQIWRQTVYYSEKSDRRYFRSFVIFLDHKCPKLGFP